MNTSKLNRNLDEQKIWLREKLAVFIGYKLVLTEGCRLTIFAKRHLLIQLI
jgi:hypothetical protein